MRPPESVSGSTLNFEYEAEYVAPVWPSMKGQQQLQTHLDIAVDDLAAAVAWAQHVGATLASYQPQDDVRVMLDPVGHRSACSWLPEGHVPTGTDFDSFDVAGTTSSCPGSRPVSDT